MKWYSSSPFKIIMFVLTAYLVSACGGGSGGAADGNVGGTSNGLQINGSPSLSVIENKTYRFTPGALNASGATLTFSMTNKPTWLTLNTATGAVSGTPVKADIGTTRGIIISVSDGSNSVSLPAFTLTVFAATSKVVLDPLGCKPMTNAELNKAGYEPVRAYGAIGDNKTDDTAAIQAAITIAHKKRRVVFFHPGTYLVSKTLEAKQEVYDVNTSNNDDGRYGNMLVGSYCGASKPTIRLADGVAPNGAFDVVTANPYPVIAMWRLFNASTRPAGSQNSRDWHQIIRNLKIIVGANPGAVGIWHRGAEGSAEQEVTIDARGAFAGMFHINSSGGYTYDLEVIGGQYGIFVPKAQGGSPLIVGLKLSGQVIAPIAIQHYAPLNIVGFDITSSRGQIVRTIVGDKSPYTIDTRLKTVWHDSGGHLSLVDGKINITSATNTKSILSNLDRSVYLKNVYVKGATTVLDSADSSTLIVANKTVWSRIAEYSYNADYKTKYSEFGKMLQGIKSDQTFLNSSVFARVSNLSVTAVANPPASLRSKHFYQIALCNVESKGNTFSTANPNDQNDDTAAIQTAINTAATKNNRVFLSGGTPDANGVVGKYYISATLKFAQQTQLCGASQFSTILSGVRWKNPAVSSPLIQTSNSVSSKTVLSDVKLEVPKPGGFYATGYNPDVYALLWQSGRLSVHRDVFIRKIWGDPGDRKLVQIRGNGGGKWYGNVFSGGFPPPVQVTVINGVSQNIRPFTKNGSLILSPASRQLLISGTTQALTFYSFQCQHLTPPGGAQTEIINSSNITFYGMKSESASLPVKMKEIIRGNPASLVPAWMFIRGSSNITMIGHEALGEQAASRGYIEIFNSTGITIANMGRRATATENPESSWYFVLETINGGAFNITAQGVLSLFKR